MIEDIRLYNLDFELIAIAHRVKSSHWELYYNKIGTFEAHIRIDKERAPAVFDNKYFIAVEGKKQAFVTAKQINREIVLYGKTLNYLLSKRTVFPFDTKAMEIENNPVTVCNELVRRVFISSRKVTAPDGTVIELPGVDNMTVVNNSSDFENNSESFIDNSIKSLSDIIIQRLDSDKLGHKLYFDIPNKQWVFKVYAGKSISLILSEGNRNFYDIDYTLDIQNVFDGGFFEETLEVDTEDMDTEESVENQNEKVYRFIKNSRYDKIQYPICMWDAPLIGSDETDARSNLNTFTESEQITGTVARLKFGNDYELGDKIRVQIINDGFSRTLHRRITGVKIYRESNEISTEPILEE